MANTKDLKDREKKKSEKSLPRRADMTNADDVRSLIRDNEFQQVKLQAQHELLTHLLNDLEKDDSDAND